jgi:hypothetical protein
LGRDGVIRQVIQALLNAGVAGAERLTYSIQRGSLVIIVRGSPEVLQQVRDQVESGNVVLNVNNQTDTALAINVPPEGSDEDDDLGAGAIVGIVVAVLFAIVLIALSAWLYDRGHKHDHKDRGSLNRPLGGARAGAERPAHAMGNGAAAGQHPYYGRGQPTVIDADRNARPTPLEVHGVRRPTGASHI